MQNKTVEGFALDDTYRLCFTPLTFEYRKGSDWLQVGAYIEHNESQGKHRPYVVIHIGKLVFQSGWLFDDFCCGMCEAPTGRTEEK